MERCNRSTFKSFKMFKFFKTFQTFTVAVVLASWTIAGCRQKMADQPHQRPLEPSRFFDDGMASRPAVPGTVPRTAGEQNTYLLTGKIGGQPGNALPFPVTLELLERGRERYEIFCTPCHGLLGTGQGMIVRRGFTPARSFHEPRVRQAPAGHYFEVMTRGFGTMPSYANQVSPQDRWAIIAYIRALQLSRSVRVDELPPEDRERLSKEAK
jgi:hypothetical protein